MTAAFDTAAFDKALRRAASIRGVTMKEVAAQTGVSTTTLSRMHNHGRGPDAASLAALSAWAGIDPRRFSSQPKLRPVVDDLVANTRLVTKADFRRIVREELADALAARGKP